MRISKVFVLVLILAILLMIFGCATDLETVSVSGVGKKIVVPLTTHHQAIHVTGANNNVFVANNTIVEEIVMSGYNNIINISNSCHPTGCIPNPLTETFISGQGNVVQTY